VLIELFSQGVTAEALRANIGSKSAILLQRGPVDPKFQVEGVAPTNHSFSQETRLIRLPKSLDQTDRVGAKSLIFDLFSLVATPL